jgi:hypothetical protein
MGQPEYPEKEKPRMFTEINELDGILKEEAKHEECSRKEHVLRMEIERLSSILESKTSMK